MTRPMEHFFETIKKQREPVVESIGGEPYLLVGLGNPGREYRESRHNFGFMVIDRIAETLRTEFKKSQMKALISIQAYEGKKVILSKPQTYMNCSGQAVVPLLNYYKIPKEHLLVIHDDMDLPFGTLRMRPGGGSGGQKGLESIIQLLGTQEFARLRCGIGHPPGQMDVTDYVLNRFSKEESKLLPSVLENATQAALSFVSVGIQEAMTRFNGIVEG